MKTLRYIIIENDNAQITEYRNRLKNLGVAEEKIWPSGNTFEGGVKGVLDAKQRLSELRGKGWDPKDEDPIVLIMDLALDAADSEVSDTVDHICESSSFFDKYVLFICSKAASDEWPRLKNIACGFLSKKETSSLHDPKEKLRLFGAKLNHAIRQFHQRRDAGMRIDLSGVCKIRDDLNLRLFEAKFGAFVLPDLLEEILQPHQPVPLPNVSLVPGGFSGSGVVSISFQRGDAGSRAFIVKIADSEALARQEYEKLQDANASVRFSSYSVSSLTPPKKLAPYEDKWYFEQRLQSGETLERVLLNEGTDKQRVVACVAKILQELSKSGQKDLQPIYLHEVLKLSETELFRIAASVDDFSRLEKELVARGNLSGTVYRELKRLDSIKQYSASWGTYLKERFPRPAIAFEQHGDLNPRNIMIEGLEGHDRTAKLIDFARFGVWPLHYDLIRLKLQLGFRLLDPPESMRDHFFERIEVWDRALTPKGAGKERMIETYRLVCAEIDRIISAPTETAVDHSANIATADLVRHLEIFDLFKMISYQDASWPKRVWFALLLMRRMEGCGALSPVRQRDSRARAQPRRRLP